MKPFLTCNIFLISPFQSHREKPLGTAPQAGQASPCGTSSGPHGWPRSCFHNSPCLPTLFLLNLLMKHCRYLQNNTGKDLQRVVSKPTPPACRWPWPALPHSLPQGANMATWGKSAPEEPPLAFRTSSCDSTTGDQTREEKKVLDMKPKPQLEKLWHTHTLCQADQGVTLPLLKKLPAKFPRSGFAFQADASWHKSPFDVSGSTER